MSVNNKPRGNAAAMREALVKVKKLFDGRLMFQPDIRAAHKAVNAALAEPPRQCDVGTAEEQELRFEEHCNNYNEYCDGCPVPQIWHRGDMVGKCRLAWAQMPYEVANESEAK